MLTRLTALILTLCIGLPMCWCCIAAPQRAEVAGCCAMKKKQHAPSHQSPSHSQDPTCPCARHESSRDVASTLVKAPAPALKLLAEPVWIISSLEVLTSSLSEKPAPRHDHGPPLHAPPLYARHCAMLI
ncbi:hypothetical protein [Prosthecobacter sp.]|uniref:hypothetical protein n=1 Tax=Prosthecobacter sp. TaxID=1965333 RepID=UPI0037841F12